MLVKIYRLEYDFSKRFVGCFCYLIVVKFRTKSGNLGDCLIASGVANYGRYYSDDDDGSDLNLVGGDQYYSWSLTIVSDDSYCDSYEDAVVADDDCLGL